MESFKAVQVITKEQLFDVPVSDLYKDMYLMVTVLNTPINEIYEMPYYEFQQIIKELREDEIYKEL